ncbi:hypothetical protein BJX64DRAFT_289688 [Aspergillus heterothallicus]
MSTAKDSSAPPVVRRSKTMPTDSPTAKFLYTILKQLDLKGIDWSLVASQLEISNGHAARMRYHRFKNQMEGTTSTPRKRAANRTTTTSKSCSASGGSSKTSCSSKDISPVPMPMPTQMIKTEQILPPNNSFCEAKPYIKTEIEQYPQHVSNLVDIPHFASSSSSSQNPMPAPLPAPIPYRQMSVAPELGMYSGASMAMYNPISMGMGYAQGCCSPVAWKPVKVEEDNIFAKQGMEVDTVKEETVPDAVKPVE